MTASPSPSGDLVIIGAGGFARETAQAVLDLNRSRQCWRLLGYLDDDPSRHGSEVDGLPVLGGRDRLPHMPEVTVVVCTGRPADYVSRKRIVDELGLPLYRFATIIHPSAVVSASSVVGPGSVLLAHVAVTASVRIGAHVAVMPHVTLTHDCVISDYVTIASRVAVGGGVQVGQAAYLGAGSI